MGVFWVWRGGEVGWYKFLTGFYRYGLLGVQGFGEEWCSQQSVLRPCSWLVDTLVSITSTATVSGREILESGF